MNQATTPRRRRLPLPLLVLPALLLAQSPSQSQPPASAPDHIARAERLAREGQPEAAARHLETALPKLSKTERPPILDRLAELYQTLADLERDNNNLPAAREWENARNLARKAAETQRRTKTTEKPDKPNPEIPPKKSESTENPTPKNTETTENTEIPRPTNTENTEIPRPTNTENTENPIPLPDLAPGQTPDPEPQPEHDLDPEDIIATLANPARADEPQTPNTPARPDPDHDPETLIQTQPQTRPDPAAILRAADDAFVAKDYPAAGRLYAALHDDGQLPPNRREHWAYCRWHAVVQVVNANPDPADWPEILREIDAVDALAPRSWFGEYLRNLVAERGRLDSRAVHAPRPARNDPAVQRASAPLDPVPRRGPGAPDARRPKSETDPNAKADADAAPSPALEGRRGPDFGASRVWETANFRVVHPPEGWDDRADHVARRAERLRRELFEFWAPESPAADGWLPRCDIHLHPDPEHFRRVARAEPDIPGFSAIATKGARVVSREIHLRADLPETDDVTLPREIAHLVLADLLPRARLPRWADEGAAALAEPAALRDARLAEAAAALRDGELLPWTDFLSLPEPPEALRAVHHAQSVSLVRFLVERRGPDAFLRLLREAPEMGYKYLLDQIYDLPDLDALDAAHREFLARDAPNPALDAAPADPPQSNDLPADPASKHPPTRGNPAP